MVKDEDLNRVLGLAEVVAKRYGYEDYGSIVLKYKDQPVAHILRQVKWRALNYYSRNKQHHGLVESPTVESGIGEIEFLDFVNTILDPYDRLIFELWLWGIDATSEGYSAQHVEEVLDRCFMKFRIAYRELRDYE